MGGAKRMMEEREYKLQVATDIAVKAGVLTKCKHHDVVMSSDADYTAAYKYGNINFASEYSAVFDSPRDMTDHIKTAADESAMDCWECERWNKE